MTIGEYPDGVPAQWRIPPSVFTGGEAFPHFTDVAAQAGVNTRDLGGGVAVEDYDGDGVLDVVVSSSNPKSARATSRAAATGRSATAATRPASRAARRRQRCAGGLRW